jgi:hypothetical protein
MFEKSDFQCTCASLVVFKRLNYNVVTKTSPVLLRKFLECIFINVDLKVKESQIYPDVLIDEKIQSQTQIERLQESEKMLFAIELAAWLNDVNIFENFHSVKV